MSMLIWIFVEHLPPPGALQITHLAATRRHFSFFFFFFHKASWVGILRTEWKSRVKRHTEAGSVTFFHALHSPRCHNLSLHCSQNRQFFQHFPHIPLSFFLRTCQLKRGFKNHNNLKIGVFPLPSMCFIPIPTLSSLKTQQWSRDHLLGPWFLKASLHLGVTVGWPSWTDTTL